MSPCVLRLSRQTDGACRVMSWLAAVRFRIFRLMSENMKTKIYRTVILCDALNERETWCVTLRENGRLRVLFGRKVK